MGTMMRRATRDRLTKRNDGQVPAGVDGTITGGPLEPIDLMRILEGGARVSRGGAVSGAAQVAVSTAGTIGNLDRGIALSDGSRISFTSIADAGLVKDENDFVSRDEVTAAARNGVAMKGVRVLTTV